MKTKKKILECSICGTHNYKTTVSQQHTARLTLKKYCPKCQKHTLHQETR
ncbi:50S ribosomal protein L33 [Bombilactobacillus bombi]|nr:50S ribosomal protein L33 [Bombilactobacillus bombi]MBA1434141.1 50S ribosomal protein L33 [Bombilactobacillus bombi]